MEGSVSSVNPTFYSELLSLRCMRRFKELSHPSSWLLCLFKIKLLCINNLLHWNITVMWAYDFCLWVEFIDECFNLIDLVFWYQINFIQNNYVSKFNLVDKKLTKRDFCLLLLSTFSYSFYNLLNRFQITMEIKAINYSNHSVESWNLSQTKVLFIFKSKSLCDR